MSLEKGIHDEVIEAKLNRKEDAPLKSRVNTFPLNSGGANFKTHKLVLHSISKVSYRPTILVLLIVFCFLAVGVGAIGVAVFVDFDDNIPFWTSVAFGFLFTLIGSFMFYLMCVPTVFDKTSNYFYEGFGKKDISSLESSLSLSDIVAFQIIGKSISNSDANYNSFELNLVLNDASRINVVDHGNLKAIIKDAEYLSEFLDVPIWHASSHIEDYK